MDISTRYFIAFLASSIAFYANLIKFNDGLATFFLLTAIVMMALWMQYRKKNENEPITELDGSWLDNSNIEEYPSVDPMDFDNQGDKIPEKREDFILESNMKRTDEEIAKYLREQYKSRKK